MMASEIPYSQMRPGSHSKQYPCGDRPEVSKSHSLSAESIVGDSQGGIEEAMVPEVSQRRLKL
jgi:hypothetical protein